jgi:hypothetical protein
MKLINKKEQEKLESLTDNIEKIKITINAMNELVKQNTLDIVSASDMLKNLEKEKKELLKSSIKKFELEEMGRYFENWLDLKDDFVRKNINLWDMENKVKNYWKKDRPLSKVACPFCKEGVLEMIEAKKDICETHVVETGMSYKFKCSNECYIKESKFILITYNYTHTHC